MKKFTLSVATLMLSSTFAIGNTYDADGPDSYKSRSLSPNTNISKSYYAGVAYGLVNTEFDATYGTEKLGLEMDQTMITLHAGYSINEHLSIEGRYWIATSDADTSISYRDTAFPNDNFDVSGDFDDDSKAWGVYLKPMYPISDTFTVYGLVGYGNVKLDIEDISGDDDGLQWGLGASYNFNQDFAVYVDYVSLYDDDSSVDDIPGNFSINSWNFGVNFRF